MSKRGRLILGRVIGIVFVCLLLPFFFGERDTCPLCKFSPFHEPSSSKHDVILASALSEMKRVEYFIRTLRTTGCRARVILFLDNLNQIDFYWKKILKLCDIEVVLVHYQSDVIHSAPKLSRYYHEYEWLKNNIKDVNRVLHTDTFDVIFQSDPFISDINESNLYFTLEPVTLSESLWTEKWIEQCYGLEVVQDFSSEFVSCSGVTLGGAKPYFKYLEILVGSPQWSRCFGHSLDQAHHNYLLFSGDFQSAGLSIEFMDCQSPYLTMHFCCKKQKCTLKSKGVLYINSSNPPVLIHQYNRWKNITQMNFNKCPKHNFYYGFSKFSLVHIYPSVSPAPMNTIWPP